MARTRVAKLAMNRGLVSRLALARADIKRLAMAAEVQTNWVTRVLGSMMLRPGWGYLGSSYADSKAFSLPFVFSVNDKASLEITNVRLRVWISDALVTRVAVATVVTNGTFDTNLTNWTSADEAGATSAWQTGGYMGLTGNGTAFAIRRQQLTVAAGDQNKEHALKIVINRGPVVLRVGSVSAGDEYINETTLGTGNHSLAFTPTGASAWVEFKSRLERIVLVDECSIEAAGAMVVTAPWLEADITKIRADQSADIVFVACDGYQQYKIERRATRSWSVVLYQPEDGPFRTQNVSKTTLTASALTGNITLTASQPIFRSTQVGGLFQHTSVGQKVQKSITAQNVFSDSIRITGVDATRIFTIVVTGLSGTGSTVTLQRSLDAVGSWVDVESYVVDTTKTLNDALNNQIAFYRIGVKTGNYVAGTIVVSLAIGIGSIVGVARITGYTSTIQVSAEVLSAIGGLTATDQWAEGQWSTYRGFPTSVAFHEGRLGWGGRDAIILSISDAFDGFNPNTVGASGPINRTIGSGPVDTINWMMSLQRLLLGGQGTEFSIRASSLDEILTPTNFNLRPASTQGSAAVAAVKVDQSGIFVQRGGVRVYELSFTQYAIDYGVSHLSALIPEIGLPSITKMLVQRQPDTRIHCIRSDGTVAMMVFDKLEQVVCWLNLSTDGVIEDGVVLPAAEGDAEDLVYYWVKRTINGATKRYYEKWAFESQCVGATLNRQADSFITYNQAASATIGGLTHLIAKSVVVWDNGKCLRDAAGDIATFVVDGTGQITVTNAGAAYQATTGVVGLAYSASWKSAKLVELMEVLGGSGLLSRQELKSLGLILADVHAKGLKYGHSLVESEMRDLPSVEATGPVDPDTVRVDYAAEPMTFPSGWSTDARICLLAKAPRPCTVLAAIAELEQHG